MQSDQNPVQFCWYELFLKIQINLDWSVNEQTYQNCDTMTKYVKEDYTVIIFCII